MSSTDNQRALDEKKVREMRRLMAEGGDKAVEHRFGEQAKASPEYQRAARQQAALKRQAGRQRAEMAREATDNERDRAKAKGTAPATVASPDRPAAAKAPSPGKQPGQSARDRVIARRRDEQERPKESLSR